MRKTNPRFENQKISLGDGRSVFLSSTKGLDGFRIDFVRPIRKDDVEDGKIVPPINCGRNKSRIHTQITLSTESARALKELLDRFDL